MQDFRQWFCQFAATGSYWPIPAWALAPRDSWVGWRAHEWPLNERAGIFLVAVHDRIGAHVSDRLDRERRVEAAHRREGRAADDEQVRDVPALAVAIHHGSLRIIPHARAALMVRARGALALGRAPHVRRARGAAQLLQLPQQELDA